VLAFILAASLAANTDKVLAHYEKHEAQKLVPMLGEVIRFPTYAHNEHAHAEQKAWLMKTATDLGFVTRDAGKITEIELPGPENAPVLGLVIHGDVQPADVEAWTFSAFGGEVRDGYVLGRGAADDKGPLIQALLAMKSLKESGLARTHTIRLLVGSEEESSATEMAEYLKDHQPPDYSLVLDSEFPVVVGEKAWDGAAIVAPWDERPGVSKPYKVLFLEAGLSPSIVPDRAEVKLKWREGPSNWEAVEKELTAAKAKLPPDTRLAMAVQDDLLRVVAYGKSAHSGVNLTGGRNALVALARVLEGKLPSGGVDDLLAFVRLAGQDLHGTGLGIKDNDPIWGRYGVNVATIKPLPDDPANKPMLFINLRRIPPRTAADIRTHLLGVIDAFNKKQGSTLSLVEGQSYFEDEPLGFDPNSKIVKRLMTVYQRATGEKAKPAISGGGTYAKRLPNAIAFGMWFPGKPYPGHDLDEKISIEDLQRGSRVLIHALVDIATQKTIRDPFKP
jgi:succinyl-diaminopimelate desuccinylase